MPTEPALISAVRVERLASAFELCEHEVVTDTRAIVDWRGSAAELDLWLSNRHAWRTNEAYYFVRWARLHVWFSQNGMPD